MPNILRLEQAKNTNFDANASNEMLLIAAKYPGHSFCRSWAIKGKSIRSRGIPPIQIRSNMLKVTSATKRRLLKIRHWLRIFLSHAKVMLRFQDDQVFVFRTIPLFTQSIIMSMSAWDRVQFWIYLLNHNSLSHQTWPIDTYKQGL